MERLVKYLELKAVLFFVVLYAGYISSIYAMHIEDSDELVAIGENVELVVVSDVNIKPGSDSTRIGNGYINCYLESNKENVDRFLPKGKSLNLGAFTLKATPIIRPEYYNVRHIFVYEAKVKNFKSISRVTCQNEPDRIDIGMFKKAISQHFKVIIPAPVEID